MDFASSQAIVWIKKQDYCEYNCVLVFLAVFFLVTLPGTYARLLAVTWGKPVFGCFPILDWIGFSSWLFWRVEFGVLSAHRFLPVFGHPSIFGFLLFFCHGFGVR